MATKGKARPAGLRVWQLKLGTSRASWRAIHAGHLVYWTGKDVKSVDIATGREVGKAKADVGAPFLDGDNIWVPTSKGFDVRTPALAARSTVAVPVPKGTQFRGAAARVYDGIAYRVTRSTAVTKVGTELRQDYHLHAYEVAAKKERYHALVKSTAYPQVQGVCSRDRFAIELRTDKGFEVLHGATADGKVAGSTKLDQSHLVLAGGDIYQQGVGSKLRRLRDTWIELDCTGEVHAIGEHVYCIGHREIVRLDGTKVAARAPIATPKFSDEAHRRVPTSACLTDGGLLVIERRERIAVGIEEATGYRRFVRDPLTLRELGAAQEFEELSWLSLVGRAGDVYVAQVMTGFVGLRF